MYMKLVLKLGSLVGLLLLSACSGGGGDDSQAPSVPTVTSNYETRFSPDHVIGSTPAPDTITASANLSTTSGGDIIASGSVAVNGATATSVTINVGYAGENGPVTIALTDGGGGTWNIPAGVELDQAELNRLDATGYYVWIETPAGDLRGQITLPEMVIVSFDMDADTVVPASTSTGSGKAGFAFNPQTGFMRARITLNGVGDAVSAGIHSAISGARGDVEIAMEVSATDPNVWGSIDINNANAGTRLGQAGIDLIVNGEMYFSVESTSNPEGDLRAQIIDTNTMNVFDSELTPSEVVTSGAPVSSSAQGVATVTWIKLTSRFGIAVNTDTSNVVSVGVYQGPPGVNGTLMFSLMPDVMTAGNWVLTPKELTQAQAEAFESGTFYASVESTAFPGGELRGQLSPTGSTLAPVSFTVDESVSESVTVTRDGGALSLDVPGGALFALDVPLGALFSPETEFGMVSISDVQGLPPGFTPIGAVKLDPAGSEFMRQPELAIDLRGTPRPPGQIVIFLANDDGSDLTYLVPRINGSVSELIGNGPFSADIPHFSAIILAASDLEGPGIPDADSTDTELSEAEKTAKKEINKEIQEEIRREALGTGDVTAFIDLVESHLADWEADLIERARNLNNDSALEDIQKFFAEALRIERARDVFGSDDGVILGDTAAGTLLIDKLQLQIETLNSGCLSGNAGTQRALIQRLDFLNSVEYADILPSSLLTSITPANFCLSMYVNPEFAAGFVPFAQTLSARVVDAQESEVDAAGLNAKIAWFLPGLPTQKTDTVNFDWNRQGEFNPRAYFGDRSPVLSQDVVLYGLPSMLGTWSATASGTTTGCDDDDDNGDGSESADISISTQSIQGTSELAFRVGGSGGEGGLTVNSIDISVLNVGVSETTITGEASGSASYTIVEDGFDEDGNPVTHTTAGTAQFSGSLESDQFSLSGTATDSSGGCTSTGTLTLQRL